MNGNLVTFDILPVLVKGYLVIGFVCCVLCDTTYVSTDGRCPLGGAITLEGAINFAEDDETVVVNTPPTITLKGVEVVKLEFGQTYAKCGATPRLDEKCDRGTVFRVLRRGLIMGFWGVLEFL